MLYAEKNYSGEMIVTEENGWVGDILSYNSLENIYLESTQ